MPLFNQIGQPRFNSPLVRFFGMKIGGAAAPALAPEIAPSFDVNQMDDPQQYFLRGEKLCSYANSMAAAVGFYGTALLRNPAGSGIVVVMRRVLAWSATQNVLISWASPGTSDLTTAGYCTPLDNRWGAVGTVRSAARYTNRNDSAGPLSGSRLSVVPANCPDWLPCVAIVTPGNSLCLETQQVNNALAFGFEFFERQIPAEELETG